MGRKKGKAGKAKQKAKQKANQESKQGTSHQPPHDPSPRPQEPSPPPSPSRDSPPSARVPRSPPSPVLFPVPSRPPDRRRERDLRELSEMFPAHSSAHISRVYDSFPPNSITDVATFLITDAPERPSGLPADLQRLQEIFPTIPIEHLREVLDDCGNLESATEYFWREMMQSGALGNSDIVDRVTYRTFLELDMHGANYTKMEWITVIRAAIDDAVEFGVEAIDFIPGQGKHSSGDPVLRPLTVATLLWLDYEAIVAPENPGIVRANMKIGYPKESSNPKVRAFIAKYPHIPGAPAETLLAFANHDETSAVNLAETIRRGLERSDADVAPPEERQQIRRQNEIVFRIQDEFAEIPASVVKKVVVDLGYQEDKARARLREIAGKVDGDSLGEVFEVMPNVPVETIIAELENVGGDSQRARDNLLQMSTVGLQNAQGVFGARRRLMGVRKDGGERQRPILELDISGASRERAGRNIRRIVDRFLAQPFGYGEVRIRTSWLNPQAMEVEWIVEQIKLADTEEQFATNVVGPVVSCVPQF